MLKTAISVVSPAVLAENMFTINAFIKESYAQAKQQVQGGMNFLKDEFTGLYDKTADYLSRLVLPVNNFLKDFSQIENEFRTESGALPVLPCHVPISIAIQTGVMEENY
ncbi:MAG: hypothetical protein U0U70_16550 [Chitinophagaceae bacterium]